MIIFPMAGQSSRFKKAGYGVDKFMLEAHGRSLFAYAVGGFEALIGEEPFLFIHRGGEEVRTFIRTECARLGFAQDDYRLVALDAPTRGQAETVALGLAAAGVTPDSPLTIFNIDSFRPGFQYPSVKFDKDVAGYLEVFSGEGDHWSFVKPVPGTNLAQEVAEKHRISNLCSTGLYYFRTVEEFNEAYSREDQRLAENSNASELYVAPLYNHLIDAGQKVCFHEIDPDQVIFCGIPSEYDSFLARGEVFLLPDRESQAS